MSSVQSLAESGCLRSVPSKFVYSKEHDDSTLQDAETIPIIDFSLLTRGTAAQRFEVIQDLGHACREWGFFVVINHGVSGLLRSEMLKLCESFFYDVPDEEKGKYAGKKLFDPIRYGTGFNATVDQALFWRNYLKIHVHPHCVAPQKPPGFSEIIQEYCKRTREVANELLKGISISLGEEESYISEKTNMELESHQLLVVNLYPPCPQPEMTIGLPPHSDHGFLTILMQNELEGLEVMHNEVWARINPLPDSFVVNIGDHMEILTNGNYKSVLHQAVVNKKATRISVATAHGPPLETIVSPAPEFADCIDTPPAFRGIKYKEYLQLQQSHPLNRKTCLDRIRI